MEQFVKGDVVVVKFPFSDLSQVKRRPALVLAGLEGDDDRYAQLIEDKDWAPFCIECFSR